MTYAKPLSDCNWYVLYTYPQYEKKVYNDLLKLNYASLLPTQKVTKIWSDRKKKVDVPLFPNYVFVRISHRERYKALNVHGVARFISFEQGPVTISEKEIETIAKLANGIDVAVERKLALGDKVSICGGPFDGMEGLISNKNGKNRFFVELSSLKQVLSVELSENYLKRINK